MAEASYLTVEEVAERLRVSRMTIYRLCKSGEMPNTRIGRQYRVSRADFTQWVEDQRTKPQEAT